MIRNCILIFVGMATQALIVACNLYLGVGITLEHEIGTFIIDSAFIVGLGLFSLVMKRYPLPK